MNQCYVYGIVNPLDNQIFYVGKSRNTDGKFSRPHYHLKYSYDSDRKSNPHKFNKINKIRSEGMEPVVQIIASNLSDEEASLLEIKLINEYGRAIDGGILTNIGRGGEGNTSNEIAVDQYNLYGEFIQTFSSLSKAALSCGRTNSSSIVECCNHRGKSKSAWGYLWAYRSQPIDLEWCWANKRPVLQLKNGYTIQRYPSASTAAKSVNSGAGRISAACKSGASVKGYTWKFM